MVGAWQVKIGRVVGTAAAVAVEKVSVGIDQEAGLVISVQRAQPYPPAAAEWPRRVPIMSLQIAQQGNLPFQLVESLAVHGLLASIGRIRQNALRSQETMVGARKKYAPMVPVFTQQHMLDKRRCAHRRTVEESGKRAGSLQ